MCNQEYPDTQTQQLQRDIQALDAWYQVLEDQPGDQLGRTFRKAFNEAACTEHVNTLNRSPYAVFTPFDSEGFINRVSYGREVRASLQGLFVARNHEGIHAIQFNKAAAPHADLFNCRANVIIEPRDYLRMREFAEKDAYSKELWLASMAADKGLLNAQDEIYSFLPVSAFKDIRDKSGDLPTALVEAATQIMQKNVRISLGGQQKSMQCRDAYQARALQAYANGLLARRLDLEAGNIVFARLQQADIKDVGDSFGPNLADYGGDSGTPADNDMTMENRIILNQIESWLGLGKRDDLPAFSEALASNGQTPAGFLQESRESGKPKPPKPLAYR